MNAEIRTHCETIDSIVRAVEDRCLAADGPVTPALQEINEEEFRRLWRAANRILSIYVAPREPPRQTLRQRFDAGIEPRNQLLIAALDQIEEQHNAMSEARDLLSGLRWHESEFRDCVRDLIARLDAVGQ